MARDPQDFLYRPSESLRRMASDFLNKKLRDLGLKQTLENHAGAIVDPDDTIKDFIMTFLEYDEVTYYMAKELDKAKSRGADAKATELQRQLKDIWLSFALHSQGLASSIPSSTQAIYDEYKGKRLLPKMVQAMEALLKNEPMTKSEQGKIPLNILFGQAVIRDLCVISQEALQFIRAREGSPEIKRGLASMDLVDMDTADAKGQLGEIDAMQIINQQNINKILEAILNEALAFQPRSFGEGFSRVQ